MSIERYTLFMACFHGGLFFFLIVVGVVEFFIRIRKRILKFWWVTPCAISYSQWTTMLTLKVYMVHDDVSHPDYWKYMDWRLRDFVFLNIKILIIWLLIGALLYFLFEKSHINDMIKVVCASLMMGVLFLFFGVAALCAAAGIVFFIREL